MEDDRLKKYRARNGERSNFVVWHKCGDRYNAWVAIMPPALVAQNFTENGWGLTRAPKDLTDDLLASLHDGLDSASTEKPIDAVETTDETRPWLIG